MLTLLKDRVIKTCFVLKDRVINGCFVIKDRVIRLIRAIIIKIICVKNHKNHLIFHYFLLSLPSNKNLKQRIWAHQLMRLLPICKRSLTRREKKFIVDNVSHWSRMMILTNTLRVYDLYNHYFQECRRCHQEMEEIQSKAIQKIQKNLSWTGRSPKNSIW